MVDITPYSAGSGMGFSIKNGFLCSEPEARAFISETLLLVFLHSNVGDTTEMCRLLVHIDCYKNDRK